MTRAVSGHLTCLDVTMVPLLVEDYYSGAGAAMLLADERNREAENQAPRTMLAECPVPIFMAHS